MPLNRYVVRVDPQGQSVTVDILDTSGVSVIVYDSPQFAAAPRTLPMVITAQTDFWLHNPGPYDVSCKVGGAEVANAGAPERVQVSDVPVLVVPDWERERTASPGGSTPGASVVRAFPFDHSTPSLVTGHTVWTPAVGDILIDAWIEVGTAWNGTTPKGDFAQFIGGDPNGCFEDQNAAVDLTVADVSAGASMPTGLLYQNVPGSQPASLLSMQANVAAGVVRTQRRVPAKFTTADPVKVVVTQDGTQGGADAGATAGAAILYLVTCTPAT